MYEATQTAEHTERTAEYEEWHLRQLSHLRSELQVLKAQVTCNSEDRTEAQQVAASCVASWEQMCKVVSEFHAQMRKANAAKTSAKRQGRHLQAALSWAYVQCAFAMWHRTVCRRKRFKLKAALVG